MFTVFISVGQVSTCASNHAVYTQKKDRWNQPKRRYENAPNKFYSKINHKIIVNYLMLSYNFNCYFERDN